MIRRLRITVPATPGPPGGLPLGGEGGHPGPFRLLAVSDEADRTLWHHLDRTALEPLDLLVSCGDLPPDYLSYLEGSLRVPFVYVKGNHDLNEAWRQQAARLLPGRRGRTELVDAAGLTVALLGWPGSTKARTSGLAMSAWGDAFGLWLASLRHRRPAIVVSHVAPHDAGDTPDVYHRGFRAYRWLAERLRPILWLHGHTTPASAPQRVTRVGPTTCVNVTGAYVIELVPGKEVP